ncbi:hypothetical protein BH23ACT9_BH23ACT9_10830 [soil metagenome]
MRCRWRVPATRSAEPTVRTINPAMGFPSS